MDVVDLCGTEFPSSHMPLFSINRENTPGLLWLSAALWHCLLEPNSAWHNEVSPTQRQPLPLNMWCPETDALDPWCKMGSYIFQVCYLLQTSSFPFERNNAGFRQAPSHWETCLDSRTPEENHKDNLATREKSLVSPRQEWEFSGLIGKPCWRWGKTGFRIWPRFRQTYTWASREAANLPLWRMAMGAEGLAMSNSWGIHQLCTW